MLERSRIMGTDGEPLTSEHCDVCRDFLGEGASCLVCRGFRMGVTAERAVRGMSPDSMHAKITKLQETNRSLNRRATQAEATLRRIAKYAQADGDT